MVAHMYGKDLHAVPELRDLGSPAKRAEGAALVRPHQPAAAMFACTSGGFVFGSDGAADQVDRLAASAGVPVSSTSIAFVHALAAVGCSRVTVAASYPQDIAELFVNFLAAHDISVESMSSAGIDTAAEVERLTPQHVQALALGNDDPNADALLIPDTAMHTMTQADELEALLDKPVSTANAVTVREGLRIAGLSRHAAGLAGCSPGTARRRQGGGRPQ